METLNWTVIYAWIFIGCAVWAILMGAMFVHCWLEDISEIEYYALTNEKKEEDYGN